MDRSTNHALRCGNSLGKQGKVNRGLWGWGGGGGGTDRIACIVRLAHGKHRVSNKNTATRLGPIRLGKPGVGPGSVPSLPRASPATLWPPPSAHSPPWSSRALCKHRLHSACSQVQRLVLHAPKWLSFTVGDGDWGGGGGAFLRREKEKGLRVERSWTGEKADHAMDGSFADRPSVCGGAVYTVICGYCYFDFCL